MTEISFIKPVTHTLAKGEITNVETIENIVYFFLGLLEILLFLRLILKLFGVSIASSFVSLIYGLSNIVLVPFEGIFSRLFSRGISSTSIIEPGTIVAMIIYAIIAWGVVRIIQIFLKGNN